MNKYKDIAVYGGGSWGTALACQIARCYDKVDLLLRDNNILEEIVSTRTTSLKYS